jgi:hypothetical protein
VGRMVQENGNGDPGLPEWEGDLGVLSKGRPHGVGSMRRRGTSTWGPWSMRGQGRGLRRGGDAG